LHLYAQQADTQRFAYSTFISATQAISVCCYY